jgi:hypothetical protein
MRKGALGWIGNENKGQEAFREFKKKWRKPLEYAYKNLNT